MGANELMARIEVLDGAGKSSTLSCPAISSRWTIHMLESKGYKVLSSTLIVRKPEVRQ